MKRLILVSVMVVFVFGLIFVGYAGTAEAKKPIVLKAVTFLPPRALPVAIIPKIVKKVAATSNGELVVNHLGGPEVMPPPAFVEGLRKGIIQMACMPAEMYDGVVPVGHAGTLSQLTYKEEMANGAYDLMNKLHEEKGLHLLIRATPYAKANTFNIQTNKRVMKPKDLKGQKIMASSSIMDATLEHYGATAVVIPNAEFYTSMERGVVDGFIEPLIASIPRQMAEVTKYIIEPAFLRGGVMTVMGLKAWQSLPPHLQKVLMKAAMDSADEIEVENEQNRAKMYELAKKAGMQVITMPKADGERMLKDIYDIGWADYEKRHPGISEKLRPLLSK